MTTFPAFTVSREGDFLVLSQPTDAGGVEAVVLHPDQVEVLVRHLRYEARREVRVEARIPLPPG